MGNSPGIIYRHYANAVTPQAAADYWSIMPPSHDPTPDVYSITGPIQPSLAGVHLGTIDNWVKTGKLPKGRKTLVNRYWTKAEALAALKRAGLIID